jgi:transaldolase
MAEAVRLLQPHPHLELIWASPRELLNIMQASAIGCQVITVTPDLLKKLPLLGKDLDLFSLETVRMFYDDARAAGFTLDTATDADLYNLAGAVCSDPKRQPVLPQALL